jgi:hypothetical protein
MHHITTALVPNNKDNQGRVAPRLTLNVLDADDHPCLATLPFL